MKNETTASDQNNNSMPVHLYTHVQIIHVCLCVCDTEPITHGIPFGNSWPPRVKRDAKVESIKKSGVKLSKNKPLTESERIRLKETILTISDPDVRLFNFFNATLQRKWEEFGRERMAEEVAVIHI